MQHVVCTNCDTVNRFETDKDPVAARCGKCDAPLFSGEPADLAAASLERQIARSDIPVVVDVGAVVRSVPRHGAGIQEGG